MTTSSTLVRPSGTPAFAASAPVDSSGLLVSLPASAIASATRALRRWLTPAFNACADIVLGAATLGVDMPLVAGLTALVALARRLAGVARRCA